MGVTHFGVCSTVAESGQLLLNILNRYDTLVSEVIDSDMEGDALVEHFMRQEFEYTCELLRAADLDTDDGEIMRWALSEQQITSQGLVVLTQRRRKAIAEA